MAGARIKGHSSFAPDWPKRNPITANDLIRAGLVSDRESLNSQPIAQCLYMNAQVAAGFISCATVPDLSFLETSAPDIVICSKKTSLGGFCGVQRRTVFRLC